MEALLQQIAALKADIEKTAEEGADALEAYRLKYLSAKGLVKSIFGEMKSVPADKKKEFGQILNEFKQIAENKYAAWKEKLEENPGMGAASTVDLTLPGDAIPLGTRHPINHFLDHVISIYQRLGFSVAEGPEIEDDWHNFTALNLPEHHPARDMQDTFYIQRNPDWLLRTHTSNTQTRAMETQSLPIRIICPGRVYRNETVSARSHCFFHQIEGLYVDENVSFADLKQTLYFFVQEMYGKNIKIRFRPSFFPFTEPSAEMDVQCQICHGEGCAVCKRTGWLEILGCGMIHPKVLENCGIDSNKYTGFAFGMGIERPAMLKYGINDIRLFSENDVRFLRQFTSNT
ncbi:phenylalanine--tRNA ligase subunit alpha [Gynurincola endophyticus]|uniref:phenylalanine--tRNA ligase subunit alpha n=1 Tax=Gynurincola endophyticus TaxID=2479004 RepID=UPI000F8CD087|nr:phenylalanine--tRNA ligase subunit alpha [Gynurincola endophyticus]